MTNNIQNIQDTNLYKNLTEETVKDYLKSNWFGKIITKIYLSFQNKELITSNKIMDVMLHWQKGRDLTSIIETAKEVQSKKMKNISEDTLDELLFNPNAANHEATIELTDSLKKADTLAAKILLAHAALKDVENGIMDTSDVQLPIY